MIDELRKKAKAFGEKHREQGTDGWQLMADFAKHHAAECVRAERERVAEELCYRLTAAPTYHPDPFINLRESISVYAEDLREDK